MDVWELVKTVARRWYIAVPVLVIAAGIGMVVSRSIDPEYRSESVLLFLPPAEAPQAGEGAAGPVNPYANVGLATVTESVRYAVSSPEVLTDLKAQGLPTSLSVESDPTRPILVITIAGRDPVLVSAGDQYVVDRVREDLRQRQSAYLVNGDVGAVTVDVASHTATPFADYSARSRIRIVLAALGVILAVAAAIVGDVLIRRHQRSRSEDADHPSDATADTEGGRDRFVVVPEGTAGSDSEPVARTSAADPTHDEGGHGTTPEGRRRVVQ